ncbi:MAG: HAD hydrolase-like protein, partial [Desulfuromonadales bacterium]
IHPHVIEFLLFLKHTGKTVWLVTNAHSKTLDLKMKKTRIGAYFDGIISAHQVGLPKEDVRFWGELQSFISYEPERTMLGEDSEANLKTAQTFLIRYLIYISRYSSKIEPSQSEHFTTIEYFKRLIPKKGSSCITI